VLTRGSDDTLLAAEKRVSLFSLIVGYRYRSEAVISEERGLASAAQIELLDVPMVLWPGALAPCRRILSEVSCMYFRPS